VALLFHSNRSLFFYYFCSRFVTILPSYFIAFRLRHAAAIFGASRASIKYLSSRLAPTRTSPITEYRHLHSTKLLSASSRIASNAFGSCLRVALNKKESIEGISGPSRLTRSFLKLHTVPRNLRNLPCDKSRSVVAESLAVSGRIAFLTIVDDMQQFAEDSPSPPLRPRHHLPPLAPRRHVESSSSRERRTSSSGTSTARTPRLSHRSRAGCCMSQDFFFDT
jgi:hypothetical protein